MERLVDEITIDKEKITMALEDIPLGLLDLDEDNPRIRYRKEFAKAQGRPVEEILMEMPEVKALRKDINLNGGLRERIIVKKHGKRFQLIEGNCRATCFTSLHKANPDDQRWHKIPARILDSDFGERKILILLADMHVAGKIAWDAHEKAGQVYRMLHDQHMTHDEVASCMRQGKATVGRLYKAYEFMMENFVPMFPKENADGKWSFFDELFRSKALKAHMERDSTFGDKFCQWVGEKRLQRGVEVRDLAAILANPDAQATFEASKPEMAVEEAQKVLHNADPEHGSDFFKLLAKVRDECTSAAHIKEILRTRTDKMAARRVLETYEALQGFMRLADIEIPGDKVRQAAE